MFFFFIWKENTGLEFILRFGTLFPQVLYIWTAAEKHINYWMIIAVIQTHHFPNLHNRKTSTSLKRKKIFQKVKCHYFFRKACQISCNYFSFHRHFKQLWKPKRDSNPCPSFLQLLKLCVQLRWSINNWFVSPQFEYMIFHIFICIFHLLRVYHELTKWLARRWLDSLVGRALHRYRRGHGFEPVQALISQLLKLCI